MFTEDTDILEKDNYYHRLFLKLINWITDYSIHFVYEELMRQINEKKNDLEIIVVNCNNLSYYIDV